MIIDFLIHLNRFVINLQPFIWNLSEPSPIFPFVNKMVINKYTNNATFTPFGVNNLSLTCNGLYIGTTTDLINNYFTIYNEYFPNGFKIRNINLTVKNFILKIMLNYCFEQDR